MSLFSVAALILLSQAAVLQAQEAHAHSAPHGGTVGRVHFPTSCSSEVRDRFEQGVAMLHSFWYEEAEKTFTEVALTDPECSMAPWGVAMSLYHPLWEPPDAKALERGRAAAEEAQRLGGRTDREQGYIAAINAFYRAADRLDNRARATAYERAMAELHARNPEDLEATVFYALAVRANAPPTDKTFAHRRRAAELLNAVFAEEPGHPGVTHYLIHSYDHPELASLALDAARRYARIAPAVPHALHMPSHIFTRLGLWQEAIDSNLATAAAARDYERRAGMSAIWSEHLHALDYLAYAYLQLGEEAEAARVLSEINAVREAQPANIASAYALATVPARYALERRDWKAAASLRPAPATFPWKLYPGAEAVSVFARALGAARSGDPRVAREAMDRLAALRDALHAAGDAYWGGQVEIQRLAGAAWLAHAEGRDAEAVELMRAAADVEDSTDKHPVTPGAVVPARELLGELLMEMQRPAEALREFEASLAANPGRRNGQLGAARAAELAGEAGAS